MEYPNPQIKRFRDHPSSLKRPPPDGVTYNPLLSRSIYLYTPPQIRVEVNFGGLLELKADGSSSRQLYAAYLFHNFCFVKENFALWLNWRFKNI
jgi:hypothetical protein